MAYLPPVLVESTPHRKRYLIATDEQTTIGSQVLDNATLQANALQPLLSAFQQGSTAPAPILTADQARYFLMSQFIADNGAPVVLPAPFIAQQGPGIQPVQSYYTPTTVCTISARTGTAIWTVDAVVDADTRHTAVSVTANGIIPGQTASAYLDIWLEHTLTR